MWGTLAWHDIRQRYRRSKIGPFWLTISMSVMIGAFGGLYAGLFRTDVAQYLPHVAVGFVVWGFVSGLTNDGCNAFIESQGSIKQVRLPLSVYVYRVGVAQPDHFLPQCSDRRRRPPRFCDPDQVGSRSSPCRPSRFMSERGMGRAVARAPVGAFS